MSDYYKAKIPKSHAKHGMFKVRVDDEGRVVTLCPCGDRFVTPPPPKIVSASPVKLRNRAGEEAHVEATIEGGRVSWDLGPYKSEEGWIVINTPMIQFDRVGEIQFDRVGEPD